MPVDEVGVIFVVVAILVLFVFFVGMLKRYRRCPSDKIMVVYGSVGRGHDGESRSAKCIHGGAAFVWPIIQECAFLDLTPFSLNIDLRGALSKQNIRVDVPASFTVGISTEPRVMPNAAERLLGLELRDVLNLANEIILGQLRLIIAQMDIEELNTQRDKFMDAVAQNVENELKKIGLRLINANITDIRDQSGYIEALGKEAEAKAINEAKRNVAERNREGNTGEKNEKTQEAIEIAEKDRQQREGVANANALAIAAEAKADTLALAAKKDAETAQRAAIAKANRIAVEQEKAAEAAQRASIASSNADAIKAENEAAALIALSEATRREAEAEAKSRAYSAEKVQTAKALSEAYAAEEKAENARAQRQRATMQADVLVQAEVEKRRIEIAADAEAEAVRRKAKGDADAMLLRMQAEADGYRAMLAKRAEGFSLMVKSANGDPSAAVSLMMTDKIEELLKTQVEAIKGVNIDKITGWDSMGGADGASTTSSFLSSMLKSVPPMKDMYSMVGLELPAGIGKEASAPKPASGLSAPGIGK